MKEWHENEQSIRSLSQQIATLEQNSGLEQVNQRMEEIKKEARADGAMLINRYKKRSSSMLGYQKFLKEKGLELSQADKQKTKDIAKLTTEIDFLYTQMNTFDSKEAELIQEFGDRVTYDLKGFIESLFKQMEDKKARLQELQAQEKSSSEKQNQLG